MASIKLFSTSLALIVVIIVLFIHDSTAAPSSISFADDSGAYASAGDTIAVASPSGAGSAAGHVRAGSVPSGSSSGGAGSSGVGLLSRSGGSSSPSKMQSVVVGPNGDATILQKSGNQPAKVYTIQGSG